MAAISRLVPGQTVYEVVRQKCGNTTASRGALYSIKILAVDRDSKTVIAAWNMNAPREYTERSIKKWKIKKPQPRCERFGLPSY